MNKDIINNIAESAQTLIQINDAHYQAQVKEHFQLKKLIESSDVLSEEKQRQFYEFLKEISPIDRLKAARLRLLTVRDPLLKSDVFSQSSEEKDLLESSADALKHLWDAQIQLSNRHPEWESVANWRPVPTKKFKKKEQRKAAMLYAFIMTRRALAAGEPTLVHLDEVALLKKSDRMQEKYQQLRTQVEIAFFLSELTDFCDYIYQNISAEDLLKSRTLPHIQKIYNEFTEYLKKMILGKKTPQDKAAMLTFFVELMQACQRKRNYLAAEMILTALPNSDIYRVIQNPDVRAHLSSSVLNTLDTINRYSVKEELELVKDFLRGGREDFVPSLRSIKVLANSIKETKSLDEKPKQESEQKSGIPRKPTPLEQLVVVAKRDSQKIESPKFLQRMKAVTSVAYVPKNSVGEELLEQLSQKKNEAFQSILEIARQASLKKQVEFVEAYCQAFVPKIKLDELKNVFSNYSDKKPASKAALKLALKNIYDQLREDYPHQKTDYSPEKMQDWRTLLETLCRSPDGQIGDLFSAPLINVEGEDPSTLDLRHAFQDKMQISHCLYLSPKSGGANNPGRFGGNYLSCYRTPDGVIHTQVIFFKQATHHGFANHRENIAEVMAGHIMNGVVGDQAAATIFAMPRGLISELKEPNPEEVYVGSLFFREFNDFNTEAHKAIDQPVPKRGKGAYGGQSIDNPVLGNPHFRTGFMELSKDFEASDLAKTLMANLLVGNYQIHTQNGGLARVRGKRIPVTFDFGGAFRRLFVTKRFKSKETSGTFAKSVNPYQTRGRKYDVSYLLAFPAEIRESAGFIAGIDEVAHFDAGLLKKNVENAIDYAVGYYGKAAFIKHFAKHLDTTDQSLNLSQGTLDDQISATKEFLIYRLLARQLSLHHFSLELKTQRAAFNYPQLVRGNPIYFKYLSIKGDERTQSLTQDAEQILSLLVKVNDLAAERKIELKKTNQLQEFLVYAMKKYDFSHPEDQSIIIQAVNQAHRAVNDALHLLSDSEQKSEIKAVIDQFQKKPTESETAEPPRREIQQMEAKTTRDIEQLYALLSVKADVDPIDGLVTNYQHLLEIIKNMAVIRQQGRSQEDRHKPIVIDLNYALLTTTNYLQIKRAMQALDGVELTMNLGGPEVVSIRVQSAVMSASSTLTGARSRERENRKAYLRLTESVREMAIEKVFSEKLSPAFGEAFAQLRFSAFASAAEESAMKDAEYRAGLSQLQEMNEKFRRAWHAYNRLSADDREAVKPALDERRRRIKGQHQLLDKQWGQPMEAAEKRAYQRHQTQTRQALAYLASAEGRAEIKKLQTPEHAQSLAMLTVFVLKAKMDALYYSGQYLQPKSAAIFNTYYQSLQRLTGLMSTGCKRGDDHTVIMQLMLAAIDDTAGTTAPAGTAASAIRSQASALNQSFSLFGRRPKQKALSAFEKWSQHILSQEMGDLSGYKPKDIQLFSERLESEREMAQTFLTQRGLTDADTAALREVIAVLTNRLTHLATPAV
jgi:RasGEF domain